jgi:hypothetical protein
MDRISLLLAEIHGCRQVCGKKRQPTHTTMLDRLAEVMTGELKTTHPYDLKEAHLDLINQKTKIFAMGGMGSRAKTTSSYMYRVINKGHLQSFVKLKWPGYRNNPTRLWKSMLTKSRKGRDWLRLRDFAESDYPGGSVNGWFNSTWWTDYPLDQDVILGAYTVGMFSEWITDEVYVLRVSVRALPSPDLARVPTVVEAFLQPVFQPAEEPSAQAGVTINLSTYNQPEDGVGEFSLRPFAVESIEIKPVQLDSASRQRHQVISKTDPDVLQSLVRFYKTL